MPYTEANYENAVVSLFENDLGYTSFYGPDVGRDWRRPSYEDRCDGQLVSQRKKAYHESRTICM